MVSLQLCEEEHRFSDSRLDIPKSHFKYKIEQLCQLLKSCFVRKIPTGNNPSQTI
jgi:hypothetical protein